ncbi:hypothetical protein DIPPA_15388 [Diplonema papillatum]|nr:hypothetical protein DIPPA_15388 [Diplonema papillatum]|eukprot:gene12593-19508_t
MPADDEKLAVLCKHYTSNHPQSAGEPKPRALDEKIAPDAHSVDTPPSTYRTPPASSRADSPYLGQTTPAMVCYAQDPQGVDGGALSPALPGRGNGPGAGGGLVLHLGFELRLEKVNVALRFSSGAPPGVASVRGRAHRAVVEEARRRHLAKPAIQAVQVYCETAHAWVDLDAFNGLLASGTQLYAFQGGEVDFAGRIPAAETRRKTAALSPLEVVRKYSAASGGEDALMLRVAGAVGGRKVNFEVEVSGDTAVAELVAYTVHLLHTEAQHRVQAGVDVAQLVVLSPDQKWRPLRSRRQLRKNAQIYALGASEPAPPAHLPAAVAPAFAAAAPGGCFWDPGSPPAADVRVTLAPEIEEAVREAGSPVPGRTALLAARGDLMMTGWVDEVSGFVDAGFGPAAVDRQLFEADTDGGNAFRLGPYSGGSPSASGSSARRYYTPDFFSERVRGALFGSSREADSVGRRGEEAPARPRHDWCRAAPPPVGGARPESPPLRIMRSLDAVLRNACPPRAAPAPGGWPAGGGPLPAEHAVPASPAPYVHRCATRASANWTPLPLKPRVRTSFLVRRASLAAAGGRFVQDDALPPASPGQEARYSRAPAPLPKRSYGRGQSRSISPTPACLATSD